MDFTPGRRLRALSTLLLLAGCAGAAGSAVRPADPTAASVLDRGPDTCRAVASLGEPLVVDWEAHQRADLEEVMHDGVAVVAYDCSSLRLLKACSLDGVYGFLGVSKKEEVVQLENKDELRANLPTFGAALGKSFSAELERGSTLDVAMVLIGKKRTTVRSMTRDGLRGGAGCEGATHFVRGAFVGAFALQLGTRGKVAAAASVFAAGSSTSSKLSKYRDGQPETCSQVHAGAETAPETCAALLRLELVALGAASQPAARPDKLQMQADDAQCPAGMVRTAGKCAEPVKERPHLCKWDDATDCAEQCSRGDLGSCNNLGLAYSQGAGVAKDEARAAELYKKACDGGHAGGCNNLAAKHFFGVAGQRDLAAAAASTTRACDLGDALGCANLGNDYANGWGVPKDGARAVALSKQGCDGGESFACSVLGSLYERGEGVPKDEARAASVYKRGCDGGDAGACSYLARLYEDGRGVSNDPATAGRYFALACKMAGSSWSVCDGNGCRTGPHWACDVAQCLANQPEACEKVALQGGDDPAFAAPRFAKACDLGRGSSCIQAGLAYRHGRGVARSAERAAALLRKGCDASEMRSCTELGDLYEKGDLGTPDFAQALALYKRACDTGHPLACEGVGDVYAKGLGVPRDRRRAADAYAKACAAGATGACASLKALGERR